MRDVPPKLQPIVKLLKTPVVSMDRYLAMGSIYERRRSIAARHLKGSGIEIGALHAPLALPRGARATYVDIVGTEALKKRYPEIRGIKEVDVIDDGEKLEKFETGSRDFIIANHMLEHCENPVETMKAFFRVLKKGGILYVAIPDKRYTFDVDRRVTPLEHIIRDYAEGPEWSRKEHYRDYCLMVNKCDENAVDERVEHMVKTKYSAHFHVWTQVELFELMVFLRRHAGLSFDVKEFATNALECIFVLEKTGGEGI